MSFYTLSLFAHIAGSIGVFVGVSIWLFGALALRRAHRVEEVRLLGGPLLAAGNLVVGSVLLLAVAGACMALQVWVRTEPYWMLVATISFLGLAPISVALLDPRLRAVVEGARRAEPGPLPAELLQATRSPVLDAGLRLYLAVLFGIVFLMVTKPALVGSVIVIVVAVAVGAAASLPRWLAARRHNTAAQP